MSTTSITGTEQSKALTVMAESQHNMADSQRELVAAIKEQVKLEGRAHDLETLRSEFEMYRSMGRMDEANRVLELVTEFRRARQEVTVQAGQDSSVVEEASPLCP